MAAYHYRAHDEFPRIQITPGTHEMRHAVLEALGDPRPEQEQALTRNTTEQSLLVQVEACRVGQWEAAMADTYAISSLLRILTVQTAVGTTTDYQFFIARWGSRLP